MSEPVLFPLEATEGFPDRGTLMFFCPGCRGGHSFDTKRASPPGPVWSWNGSMERPTFTPSLLVRGTEDLTDDEIKLVMSGGKVTPRPLRCHLYVTDGQICFLSDCTHGLAGKTVPMEPNL